MPHAIDFASRPISVDCGHPAHERSAYRKRCAPQFHRGDFNASFVLVPFAALLSAQSAAQAPSVERAAAQVAAIERIGWLAGEWEGRATFEQGLQGRAEVISWERVTRVAGGTALMVLGRHYRRNADGSRGEAVHDAAALISCDDKLGKYRFQSQLASGKHGSFEAEIQGAALVWRIDTPRGPIRYRVTRDDAGRWTERGEMCPPADKPDAPCREFFSMTLAKTKPAE